MVIAEKSNMSPNKKIAYETTNMYCLDEKIYKYQIYG
jgi:hypothetical protein